MVNTSNDFLLGTHTIPINGAKAVSPVLHHPDFRTRHQAYRFAAWLVLMAEILPEEEGQEGISFEQVVKAIQNT